MKLRDTDEAISKRLGRSHNWLARLKTGYPEVYRRMFSYHENRNRSLRLYEIDLKNQQELINSFRHTVLYKQILSHIYNSKKLFMFTQTLDSFLAKKDKLCISDPRVILNIEKISNLYIETIEEHMEYVKNYKDNK